MQMRLIAAAKREPKPRKQGRIISTDKLVALGRNLIGKATETPLAFSRAVLFRDGLMIALLALRPLRISNFAGLRLGVQLLQTSSGYWVNIPPEQTKTGRPLEMPVPDALVPSLCDYLEHHRPALVRDRQTDYLWINERGRPFKPERLSQRISGLTERHLRIRVTPHLFRDCAATTIATLDPAHVQVIMPLLGHTDPRTAEDHYNYATTLEVGRELQAVIRQIRAEGVPLRYRRPREGL
jgi:integrase